MTVGDQQVEIAVIVVVEKLEAPSAHELGCVGNTRRAGDVVEAFVVFVPIESVEFVIQIGHEQIHPTVPIKVSGIDAHAGASPSPFAVGNPTGETDLLKAVPLAVDEKEVGGRIIRDKKIEPAVVVN